MRLQEVLNMLCVCVCVIAADPVMKSAMAAPGVTPIGVNPASVSPASVSPSEVSFQAYDGRGQPFDLRSLRGQVVAVSFGSRYTRAEAGRVFAALGQRARAGQVATVGVIDFVGIPRFLHGYARRKVQESDDARRTKLLVDEHSALQRSLQTRPDQRVDILILDRTGALRGRYVGEAHVAEALSLLERLAREDAAQLALAQ